MCGCGCTGRCWPTRVGGGDVLTWISCRSGPCCCGSNTWPKNSWGYAIRFQHIDKSQREHQQSIRIKTEAQSTGPGFVSRKVPQRVLYYYFIDKELGLIHVRLQTWAPFTCQVYANGHDYVARQLKNKGIAFKQVDNAFVELGDPVAAQRIADRFAKLPWPKILERYARQVNPLLDNELRGVSHYWVIDQAEYATDLCFSNKHALAGLFLRLLELALLTFSPKKI